MLVANNSANWEDDVADPEVENPLDEGRDAFARGVQVADCPYPDDSEQREEWLEGWDQRKHHPKDTMRSQSVLAAERQP